MDWSSKMHNKVIGNRVIIAEDVIKIFQCIFSHVRAYYRVFRYYTGLNFFWVIDNNADVSSAMDCISKKGNARSVSTFSTLYLNPTQ